MTKRVVSNLLLFAAVAAVIAGCGLILFLTWLGDSGGIAGWAAAGVSGVLIVVGFLAAVIWEERLKRQHAEEVSEIAKKLGLVPSNRPPQSWLSKLTALDAFTDCDQFVISNWMSGERDGRFVAVCDLKFEFRQSPLGFTQRQTQNCTLAMTFDAIGLPEFQLSPKSNASWKYVTTANLPNPLEIPFDSSRWTDAPAFHQKYQLLSGRGSSDSDQTALLFQELLGWFAQYPGWSVVSNSGMFFVWMPDKCLPFSELLPRALEIRRCFPKSKSLRPDVSTKSLSPDISTEPPEPLREEDLRTGTFYAALVRLTPNAHATTAFIVVNFFVFGCLLIGCLLTGTVDLSLLSIDNQTMLNWGANFRPITTTGQWWRLFTSPWLHFDVLHVAFNMYVLLLFGSNAERLVGSTGFAITYGLCGVFASLGSLKFHPTSVCAGASGAVFGVIGLLVGWSMVQLETIPKQTVSSWGSLIGRLLVANLVYGIVHTRIDVAAHIVGLAAGFLCGLVLSQPLVPESLPQRMVRNMILLMIGIIVIAVGMRTI